MAYKYFTEKLLSRDIDLSQVFSEKQQISRESNNVSYNLGDIALFVKDKTENFKRAESQYVDLDNAMSEIISKWYKSQNKKNPFVDDLDDSIEEFKSKNPREAAIVDKGIKSKGAPKGAPDVKAPKAASEVKAPKAEMQTEDPRITKFKKELANQKEGLFDDGDDNEKADFIKFIEDKLEIDSDIAEDGDEYFVNRVQILKDFIKQLK